jgi:hypothetical protein
MVTQITMIPELQLGIIVLTNQQEGLAFQAITNQIKDGYFGMAGTDRVTQYAAIRKRQLDEAKHITDSIWHEVSAFQLQQNVGRRGAAAGSVGRRGAEGTGAPRTNMTPYLGIYRDPWLGEIVISMKDGKPWFDSKRSPKLTGEMLPYKGNSFIVKWRDRSMDADAYVIFGLDERGLASSIKMKPISPLTDFSYDFQDLDFQREK